MESKTITFFNWSDIQTEICKEMGIEEKYFRDYHQLIGGDYKDLWHQWMEYFESDITNGQIVSNDLGESMESKMEWIKEDGRDWLEPFIKAVYKVWDDYGIENVKYFW